jgi:hypothetical protein
MDATTYTGTGATNSIVNSDLGSTGFKPDLVWIKSRSAATDNKLTDSVRGATKVLISNTSAADATDTNGLTAFNTNGFTLGTDTNYNNSGATYVGWQWQAGQGSTSSNTNGSITSTVSVNATAGFSIVTWSGNGSNATIGHGLGVAPQFIAIKDRTNSYSWRNYHVSTGNTGYVYFNSTDAYTASSTTFNNTSPTTSVFSVGTEVNVNASANNYVAYCWAPVAGFSQFGSYVGNGSNDGPFVYTGFRPKFLLFKQSSASGEYWHIMDTTRSPYNGVDLDLYPNLANAESTYSPPALDLLSNGIKFRTNNGAWNGSGATYIYAAFAENPFKYANAR